MEYYPYPKPCRKPVKGTDTGTSTMPPGGILPLANSLLPPHPHFFLRLYPGRTFTCVSGSPRALNVPKLDPPHPELVLATVRHACE